jgi:P27 family predicted phage terminase small subunit
MRGRKPKPTAQQIAAGDPRKRGKGKLETQLACEPKAEAGLPACPRHLRGRARAAWTFWSEALNVMGIDKRPDAMMLEGACVNYARAVEADQIVARDGIMLNISRIDEESGEVVLLKTQYNPAITVSNAAWRQVRAFCSEFGLSPVSRTRLTIEKQDDGVEDLAKVLMQPRVPRALGPEPVQ